MVSSLIKALSAGLSLWNTKESRKYLDKVIILKREFYEEFNKQNPDDAALDRIYNELRIISEAFYSKVTKPDTENK